ncbi:Lrp/AsnC ligand binding domain-containing protein [Arenibaculum pallidiluteum]|uniref:Lrp/AsnC ligand binding domain-containing protein n=1 Tax=Arenibaculum pallidiluteum TaxID=2812559 RepID=UPI001A97BF3D|nr:Lrp/AsnC ligand binding domain-containing protein [Arenibaculum pallidiluteum]
MQIDRVDRAILIELQRDGRLTNAELARRVNLSPPACLERVRRLEKAGYILGYVALLDPAKLGSGLLVFTEIVLDRTTPEVFERFRDAVMTMPEILECHMVAGGFDYLVKARVRDMAAYRDFLGSSLVALPGVRETHTYAVMEEVKSTTAITLPPGQPAAR